MKKLFKIFVAISLSCFYINVVAVDLPKPQNNLQPLDQIVAIVNKQVITQSEVDQETAAFKNQFLSANVPLPSEQLLKKQVLERLINLKLQEQIAKRAHVTIADKSVDAAIANIAAKNNITTAQLLQKVNAQGYSTKAYRKQIRQQLLLQKLQRMAVGKKVVVTNAEVNQYLAQYKSKLQQQRVYHLLDLLIPFPQAVTTQTVANTQATAEKIMHKLNSGGHFQQIARQYQLNDLGWRAPADLPTLFAAQVGKMKINQIAGPLKAANGYHILKLIGNREAQVTTQLPTADQIKMYLFQKKFIKALNQWVNKLKKTAYVHIIVPQ